MSNRTGGSSRPSSEPRPATPQVKRSKGRSSRTGDAAKSGGEDRLHRDTPFICSIRFRNDLPELPCDPKLLLAPVQEERLGEFALTSLERTAQRPLLLPPSLGIGISAMDIAKYNVSEDAPGMHPADAALLQDVAAVSGDRTKLQQRNIELSWMMRTTYLSQGGDRGRGAPAASTASGAAHPADEVGGGGELDAAAAVAAINASFEAARVPPVHPTRPELTPVAVLPVLPDTEEWHKNLTCCKFDSHPAGEGDLWAGASSEQRQAASARAIMKAYTMPTPANKAGGGQDSKFLAWCTPRVLPPGTEGGGEASTSRAPPPPGAGTQPQDLAGEYQWVREYAYKVKRDGDVPGDKLTYLLRVGPDAATYCDLNRSLLLTKRRKLSKEAAVVRPSHLVLTHRDPNEAEQLHAAEKQKALYESAGAGGGPAQEDLPEDTQLAAVPVDDAEEGGLHDAPGRGITRGGDDGRYGHQDDDSLSD